MVVRWWRKLVDVSRLTKGAARALLGMARGGASVASRVITRASLVHVGGEVHRSYLKMFLMVSSIPPSVFLSLACCSSVCERYYISATKD